LKYLQYVSEPEGNKIEGRGVVEEEEKEQIEKREALEFHEDTPTNLLLLYLPLR